MGTSQAKLTVLPSRTVFLTGKPMANISDHLSMVNLAPFGNCRSMGFPATASATAAAQGTLTPMPCMHNTQFPWMGGKNDYLVKGDPALLKSSTCSCMWGGTISIVDDGQTGEGTQWVSKSQKEGFNEDQSNTEGIDANSVLDGIQLALDAAGFVPGFGAIPDLTNAAISALRGNWAEAGLSVLAAVPIIGDAAAAVKMAKRGKNIAKMAKRCVSKNVDVSIKSLVKRGMSVDEAKAFRRSTGRAIMKERRNVAKKFYQDNGFTHNVDGHLNGIDFRKPVYVETVTPNKPVYQFRSDKTGNYATYDKNAKPKDLGIADHFGNPPIPKEKYSGYVTKETPCLRSTARTIQDDWSIPGKKILSEGGADQLFVPNSSVFSNMIKVK